MGERSGYRMGFLVGQLILQSCNIVAANIIVMEKFQAANEEFNILQRKLSEQVNARQQLEVQLQENKIVSEELKLLDDDAKVYKLMGQVLVPQDQPEAEQNVDKRLDFIKGEITKVEKQIQDSQRGMETKRAELMELRASILGGSA